MTDKLNKLMDMSIEEIISSSHTLVLLEVYSKLYLNGGKPQTCEASLRKYYLEIKKNYQMAKEVLERTCIPAWDGRKYVPGVWSEDGKTLLAGHLHIRSDLLTDEKAKELLDIGALKKKDFKVLPGERTETSIKEYTKEELEDLVKNGKYKDLSQAARDLKLIKTSANKEKTIEVLKDHISKL